MSLNVTIHSVGVGRCSLHKTKKDVDGMTVTIGRYVNRFFSHKAFVELVRLELSPEGSPAIPQAAAVPVGNAQAPSANGIPAEVES